MRWANEHSAKCRAALLLALLLFAVVSHSQVPSPILDWQVLLADPDPVQLTDLASQYEHAIGYRRDYGRARQLYCAAARLGHHPAQRRVAWMYANGLGAPRDTDLAAAWLEVAAANGDLKARKFLVLVGEPSAQRKPRCTYESRFDAYAIATISGPVQDAGINSRTPDREQITSWVLELAPDYGLDPPLVTAIIDTNASFDAAARSAENALGLMLLTPTTAARFGVVDRADPVRNLHGGMAYLRWLLSFFGGDLRLSLAGYHAGEGAVEKYLGVPPYPQTQRYVEEVLRVYGRDSHPPIEPVVQPSKVIPW